MEGYARTGYVYNMTTGEYIGTETVYIEKATGTYPCAANVTFKRPPELRDHEAAIWNKIIQDWDIVQDWRGCLWWNADGSPGGVIEQLGATDKITDEPPRAERYESLVRRDGAWEKKIAEGWIKDKATGEYRKMTQAERIYAGIEKAPNGCKLVNGEIVAKTPDELYDDGEITAEEYNSMQKDLREAEYRRSTDKIGLMVMRGEATMEEWQAAIQAVKEQYPYKEEE